MRNIGIRALDNVGRIVIPKSLLTVLGAHIGDSFEVFTEERTVVLRKYVPGCIFCGELDDVRRIGNDFVCSLCAQELKFAVEEYSHHPVANT